MKITAIPITIKNKIKNTYNDVRTFNLSQRLQNRLEHLSYEKEKQDEELKRLKRQYSIYKTKSKGISEIEESFFNGEPKINDSKLKLALRDEIKRLMSVIEKQQELIEQTPFIHNQLPLVHKPSIVKTKNPIWFVRNYFKYRKDLKLYYKALETTRKAEVHLNLEKNENGVTVEKNGQKIYKSEYLQEHNTYLQVGEKYKRCYYLADIPAYLSPYVFLDRKSTR